MSAGTDGKRRRLHHAWESRSMRTLVLLYELELDFELVVHSFRRSLYRDDSYRRLSPAGRVPCLEDGEVVLFETGAIAEYLTETYPEKGLGRLPGDPERWEYLQWLHFAETIAQHIASLTQQHVVLREPWMRSPAVIKYETMRLARCLGVLEERLEGREFLLASGFSAADCQTGYSVEAARRFVRLDQFPRLAAYRERLLARPSFRRAQPPPDAERLYTREFYEAPPVVPPAAGEGRDG
ncbi:MAG: glutathione S-transferase family protein [Alphaproteobacteria bacterium]|nr:MAG: glutathione S-transferase family protein [Alphaproteobacteria bacterium]